MKKEHTMQTVIRTDLAGKVLAAIIALILAAIIISQNGCNPCASDSHQSGTACVPDDPGMSCDVGFTPNTEGTACVPVDTGVCEVTPGQAVNRLIIATSECTGGACDSIAYSHDGSTPKTVNPDFDGRFLLELRSCEYYAFTATCRNLAGEPYVSDFNMSAEQVNNGDYTIPPPGGDCGTPIDPGLGQTWNSFGECVWAWRQTGELEASAIGKCCDAVQYSNSSNVGYLYNGSNVDCVTWGN
jgi:hypothetical protein